jgi:hypothetical protein
MNDSNEVLAIRESADYPYGVEMSSLFGTLSPNQKVVLIDNDILPTAKTQEGKTLARKILDNFVFDQDTTYSPRVVIHVKDNAKEIHNITSLPSDVPFVKMKRKQ